MQFAITATAVIAGLVFSFAVALLVEEFIFGEVFRLFLPGRRCESNQGRSAEAHKENHHVIREVLADDGRHRDDSGGRWNSHL